MYIKCQNGAIDVSIEIDNNVIHVLILVFQFFSLDGFWKFFFHYPFDLIFFFFWIELAHRWWYTYICTCIILQKVKHYVDRNIWVGFRFIFKRTTGWRDFFLICKPLSVECELYHNPVLSRSYKTKCTCKRSLLNHYEREREKNVYFVTMGTDFIFFHTDSKNIFPLICTVFKTTSQTIYCMYTKHVVVL